MARWMMTKSAAAYALLLALLIPAGRAAPPTTEPGLPGRTLAPPKKSSQPATKPFDPDGWPDAKTFKVSAAGGWQKVMEIKQGHEFRITATGTWGPRNGPAVGPMGKDGVFHLEGRIGEEGNFNPSKGDDIARMGVPFVVGERYESVASRSGILFLRMAPRGSGVGVGQLSVTMSLRTPDAKQTSDPDWLALQGTRSADALLDFIPKDFELAKSASWPDVRVAAANDAVRKGAAGRVFTFLTPVGDTKHGNRDFWQVVGKVTSSDGREIMVRADFPAEMKDQLAAMSKTDLIYIRGTTWPPGIGFHKQKPHVFEICIRDCVFTRVVAKNPADTAPAPTDPNAPSKP